jgi:hypothetical protein
MIHVIRTTILTVLSLIFLVSFVVGFMSANTQGSSICNYPTPVNQRNQWFLWGCRLGEYLNQLEYAQADLEENR